MHKNARFHTILENKMFSIASYFTINVSKMFIYSKHLFLQPKTEENFLQFIISVTLTI